MLSKDRSETGFNQKQTSEIDRGRNRQTVTDIETEVSYSQIY